MRMEELTGALLEIPLDDLVFYERCGGGTFGSVYRSLWVSQNQIVAIKRLLVLEKEAQVLSLISHKNIIKFYGAVSKDPDFCLVTEYAPNGSLFAFLHKPDSGLDFQLIVKWATEIARGVHYLHWESPVKIIHRDLKSKNVVISTDWTCKLCDFGASRFAVNTTKMTLAGTFPWMSPEAIQSLSVSEATDVWSYGVVLWELLTKEVPFNGIEGFQVAWLIVEKGQRLTIPTTCPPSFRRLLQKCWHTDPKTRPNLKQILSLLHSMLEDESLPNLTNSFLDHKMVWKKEIQATLDQLKKAELAISNKEQELLEREMKLKEREKSLVHQLNIVKLEDHDVATWRDVDVYQWVMQLRKAGHTSDLAQYADLFLTNHITGRRLMLVTESHLKEMGITSVGHCMELLHEIETLKTHNFRLINFPPLAKNTETVVAPNQMTKDTIPAMLIFGHHLRKGPSDEETKWKMFAEIDQDDDDETSVVTLVKEVAFICKMPDFGTFTLTHPPFIMSTWCLGVSSDMTVECIVTYEPFVQKPKSTRFLYQVDGRNPTPRQQPVTLILKKANQAVEEETNTYRPSMPSMPVSPAHTNASFSISSNVSHSNLPEAWNKSFYPVKLPAPRSPSKSDLWSSIVSGKRLSVAKPIPGTTEYISDFPKVSPSTSYSKALGRNADPSTTSPQNGSKSISSESVRDQKYPMMERATFTIGGGDSNSSSVVSENAMHTLNSESVLSSNASSSYKNAITTDSVLSSASRKQNNDSIIKTPSSNKNSSSSSGNNNNNNNNGVFIKPRPFSAGARENSNNNYYNDNSGRKKRITFEREERPWMGRQMSRHTRSEPNKNKGDNYYKVANPNYRRAFSGGFPSSSNTVYLTGGGQNKGNGDTQSKGDHPGMLSRLDRSRRERGGNNNKVFHFNQRQNSRDNDLRNSDRTYSREKQGNYRREGKDHLDRCNFSGRQESRQNQDGGGGSSGRGGNGYVNGDINEQYDNSGRKSGGSRSNNYRGRGGGWKKVDNRNNLELKIEKSNTVMNAGGTGDVNAAGDEGWTVKGRKHKNSN